MLNEYADISAVLKQENPHFAKIFEKHEELHKEIEKAETGDLDHINPVEIEKLKKKKLLLKDEAYALIMEYKKNNA